MKVWLLQWWCSGSDSYLYEGLFTDIDKVNDYLVSKYSPSEFVSENRVGGSTVTHVNYWVARWFKPKSERTIYDNPTYVASLQEVK